MFSVLNFNVDNKIQKYIEWPDIQKIRSLNQTIGPLELLIQICDCESDVIYIEYMLDVYGIWILLREIFKCPCSVSEYAYICQYA